jgi:hypothetical protein
LKSQECKKPGCIYSKFGEVKNVRNVKVQNVKIENAKCLNWLECKSQATQVLTQYDPSSKCSECMSRAAKMLKLLKMPRNEKTRNAEYPKIVETNVDRQAKAQNNRGC